MRLPQHVMDANKGCARSVIPYTTDLLFCSNREAQLCLLCKVGFYLLVMEVLVCMRRISIKIDLFKPNCVVS
jgi:hypothetical protein